MDKIGKLLYVHTVSKALCCTVNHVYTLIKNGDLKAIRLGKKGIRVYESSVIEFADKSEIKIEDYYK